MSMSRSMSKKLSTANVTCVLDLTRALILDFQDRQVC